MSEEKMFFGKPSKGRVIHISKDGGAQARCDKKITLEINKNLSIKDVTCSKCQKYKVYQDYLKSKTPTDEPEPKTEPVTEEKKDIGVKEQQSKKKKDDTKKSVKPELIVEKKEPDDKQIIAGPNFIIREIKKGKEKNICIVHKHTGKLFFEKLDKMVIYDAIKNLNKIKDQWLSETDPMPKNYITKCRKAYRKAYESCGLKVPKALRASKDGIPKKMKTKKSKRRKIKRREKPKKITVRVIKRRKKKTDEPPKQEVRIIKRRKKVVKKEPAPTPIPENKLEKIQKKIHEKIEEGTVFLEIQESLMSTFQLEKDTSEKMIEQTVLLMSRKLGIPVFIALARVKEDDFYSL